MYWASSLVWMILSPLVIIMDVISILAISHYKKNFHGTDITLLGVIVPMILNAVFTVPVPAILTLADIPWTQEVCSFYVWIFCTLKLAQILGLLCLSIQWAIFLRVTSEKEAKTATIAMPWVMVGTLLLSALAAVLPTVGISERSYYFNPQAKTCAFLSFDWGIGFAMFFIIIICVVVCTAMICIADAALLIRSMKKVAVTKYQAGRFYIPTTISGTYRHGSRTVHDRYTELNFASDLCRFVFVAVMLSAAVNHLPYAVIQCLQLFYDPDRETMEFITLWLVITDCLLLPLTLWTLSKRYRHGLVYLWNIHVLRNRSAEEDPMACMLQSYVTKGSGQNGTARGLSDIQNRILRSLPRGVTPDMMDENGEIRQNSPARGGLQQIFPAEMGRQKSGVIVHAPADAGSQSGTLTRESASNGAAGTSTFTQDLQAEVITPRNSFREVTNSPSGSPSKSCISVPNRTDVQRSSSRSRQEWKEQMRRKHLPAIFVNDAFETEEGAVGGEPEEVEEPVLVESEKTHKKAGSNLSLYYLSGEYHPDNLTSSLPRQPTESESDGYSNQYDSIDIATVLDETSNGAGKARTDEYLNRVASSSPSPKPPKKPVRKQQSVGKFGERSDSREETVSLSSQKSVVLTPCIEHRRPPWLDEPMENSDTETLADSTTSNNYRLMSSASSQRSNSPSIHFDEDVDKGFEEALAIGYATVSDYDNTFGNYFDSIKEEPEDANASHESNPFTGENLSDNPSEHSFVTKAVVAKPRHRHHSSDSDNPFDKVPIYPANSHAHQNGDIDHTQSANGDSGTGTWTDYSNGFIDVEIRDDDEVFTPSADHSSLSMAWPEIETSKASEMSFDSDFSDTRLDDLDASIPDLTYQNGDVYFKTPDLKEGHKIQDIKSEIRTDVVTNGSDSAQTLTREAVYF